MVRFLMKVTKFKNDMNVTNKGWCLYVGNVVTLLAKGLQWRSQMVAKIHH